MAHHHGKKKNPPGWSKDYMELENQTAALLSSIRGDNNRSQSSGNNKRSPKRSRQKRSRRIDTMSNKSTNKAWASPKSSNRRNVKKNNNNNNSNNKSPSKMESTKSDLGEDDKSFAGLILGETTDVLDVNSNPFSDIGGQQQEQLFVKRNKSNNKRSKKRNSRKSRSNSIDARKNAARVKKQLKNNPLARSSNSNSKSRSFSSTPTSSSNNEEYKEEKDSYSSTENKSEESTPRDEVEPDGSESGSNVSDTLKDEEKERLQELERIRQEEKKLRELSFREEESRVRKGVDGFVPHPVTQVAPARKELNEEKNRLENIEARLEQRAQDRERAMNERDQRLDEMQAAEEIQRVWRGFIGRRFARVKKKEKELGYSQTMLPPLHPTLGSPKAMPRNKLPLETPTDADDFGYLRPSSTGPLSSVKKLPNIGGYNDRPQSASSSVSSSYASTEIDVMDDTIPQETTPRLFLPDGSPDVKLRETVRNALKVSRFDSVSTLLASGPMARRIKKAASKRSGIRTKKSHVKYSPGIKGAKKSQGLDGGDSMVSVMVDKDGKPSSGKNKRGKGKNKDSNNQMQGPPAMYEVEHPGFDAADPTGQTKVTKRIEDEQKPRTATGKRKTRQVCFACWSAGDDMVKRCEMHTKDEDEENANRDPEESILMCACWDVNALRRRYRAEELQEVFAKAVSSLRWDLNRKQFITVVECRHPIYRMYNAFVLMLNKRKTRIDHARAWFRSIIEEVRNGKVKSFSEEQANKSKMLKLKNSLLNFAWVQRAAKEVGKHHPRPPTTEMEMSGLVGAAELRRVMGIGADYMLHSGMARDACLLIVAPPTPVPVMLYRVRYYDLPIPVYCRVPKPSHVFSPYEGAESKGKGFLENEYMDSNDKNSWLEQLSKTWSSHAVEKALEEVYQSAPPVERYRTKYPRAVTIKYAEFMRKQTKKNLAMGGLPAIAILNQKVSTLIPPQYGNFVVIDRRSIAPKLRENVSSDFPTLQPWDPPPPCSCRALVSALDDRVTPTITVSTCAKGAPKPVKKVVRVDGAAATGEVDDESDDEMEEVDRDALDDGNEPLSTIDTWTMCIRLYHGDNRPEQTGESVYTGFRTTSRTAGLPEDPETSAKGFTPSVDVAIPNRAGNHGTVCSQADVNYPFCIPSTRPNTMYDFYELLVNDKCSSNQACCFTVLGKQDPGEFGIKNNMKGDLGLLHTKVYRSFGYIQTSSIEEFKTAEGVSYWYDPRTGETVWEKPLEEDDDEDDVYEPLERGDDEPVQPRYTEKMMRQHLLANYEKGEDSNAMKEMKELNKISIGALKELPGPQVAKGTRPILSLPTPPQSSREKLGDDALIHRTDGNGEFKGHGRIKGTPRSTPRSGPESNNVQPTALPQIGSGGGGAYQVPKLPLEKPTPMPQEGPTPRHLAVGGGGGSLPQPMMVHNQSPAMMAMQQQKQAQIVPQQAPAAQQKQMLDFFASALQQVLPMVQAKQNANGGNGSSSDADEMLRLGLGLGLGIAMRQGQQQIGNNNNNNNNNNAMRMNNDGSNNNNGGGQMISSNGNNNNRENNYSNGSNKGQMTTHNRNNSGGTGPSLGMPGNAMSLTQAKNDDPSKLRRVLPKATPPPDELEELERLEPPKDVIVQEYTTHAAATEMVTFKPVGHKDKDPVKRSAVSLPEGFIASVFESHTGKQHVDYLPSTSNINVPREVGVVKPNAIAGVWEKKGFDPWSDGKDPYSTCFVPSLNFDEDDVAKKPEGEHVDEEGLSKMQLELKQKNKEEQDMKFIFSCARHGKFREIEEAFDQPDWTVDINQQDATGATLLQVAAQNGNKRIAKFCLRRGADLNKTNLAGNTPLHYCFAYGFETLGEYLMEKGADDSIMNADGLTCYEGLNLESVEQI